MEDGGRLLFRLITISRMKCKVNVVELSNEFEKEGRRRHFFPLRLDLGEEGEGGKFFHARQKQKEVGGRNNSSSLDSSTISSSVVPILTAIL